MNQDSEGVKPESPPKIDAVREVLETIVFVLVLVITLKAFLAEWFVIPTGSMATTLLGSHLQQTCPACKHAFLVNCSQEVDPSDGVRVKVEWSRCENCGLVIDIP